MAYDALPHVQYKATASSAAQNDLIDRANELVPAVGLPYTNNNNLRDRVGNLETSAGVGSAIGVRLRRQADQHLTSGDWDIVFDTIEHGPNGVDVSNDLTTVTITESGIYSIGASMRTQGGNLKELAVYNPGLNLGFYYCEGSASGPNMSCSTVTALPSGTTLRATIYCNTDVRITEAVGRTTSFYVYKIGNV